MSTHNFTQEQLDLHTEVRQTISAAAKNRDGNKNTSERTARKAYTPEHDIQILTVLKDDGCAERFGSSSTEEKRELCIEMCDVLKEVHGQERTPDSLFYRITKLLKQSDLSSLNYRIKNDEEKPKPKAKKKEEKPVETEESAPEEQPEAETPAEETPKKETESEATTTAEPEEPQGEDEPEEFDDDDFLE